MGPFRQVPLGQDVQYFPEAPMCMMVMMGFSTVLQVSMIMMMDMVPVLAALPFRDFCLVLGKPVEIIHIMVMVLVFCIQFHQEITAVQPSLLHPADFHRITGQRQGSKGLPEHLLVRPQIQQGSYGHIPADAAFAFQIEQFIHDFPFPFCRPAG